MPGPEDSMEEHDCKCGCLAMSKLRELTKAGPPRPGLVPQSGDPEHPKRWVRPEDAEESPIVEVAPIARKPFADIGTKEGLAQRLSTYFGESASKYLRMPRSELQSVFDDVVRRDRQGMITAVEQRVPAGQYRTGGKMMKVHVTQALGGLVKGLELQGLTAGLGGLIAKGAACPPDAVPLEQLKGDLARAGHPVKRAIALDAENRRLFFIDNTDTYLFAEYGSPEVGFSLGRVGSQSEVAKDYDPVDLEPEPRSDVKVEHGEEEQGDDPGFVPSGTPGIKPVDADGRGFGNTPKPTPTSKALQNSLDKVCGCLKDQGR